MSNIDKRALREAAGKAGADEWCAFIDTKSKTYSVHTPGDNRCGDVVKWAGFDGQQRAAAKAKFIAAANPATVLALLDELEAADELNKHLELAIRKAEGCSEKLREKAEAAEKRIAEQQEEIKSALARVDIKCAQLCNQDEIIEGLKIEVSELKLAAAGKGE